VVCGFVKFNRQFVLRSSSCALPIGHARYYLGSQLELEPRSSAERLSRRLEREIDSGIEAFSRQSVSMAR
jgi:hypothetical protein